MREDGGNAEASYKNSVRCERWEFWPNRRRFRRTWALDVHEIRVGGLYKTLQLVLLGLRLSRGVEEIDGERLVDVCHE